MKTILSIVFLLSVIVSKGQGAANTQIRSIQDTVISGDSLEIRFTYTVQPNNGFLVQIGLNNNTAPYSQDCLHKNANIVNFFKKDANGWTVLKVKITPAMGVGNASVFTNISNSVYFYIKQVIFAGINELDKNATITKTEYFDIYGKEKPSTSEGLTIKVTTYSNGYQKKEKIIIQQ